MIPNADPLENSYALITLFGNPSKIESEFLLLLEKHDVIENKSQIIVKMNRNYFLISQIDFKNYIKLFQ